MAIALTYDELKALTPCAYSFERVTKLLGGKEGWRGKVDAATARKAGCTLDDIVWAATAIARKDADVERRLRLWTADCAARVLHIYEKTEKSDAPRKAIIAARRFARREISEGELAVAEAVAWNTVCTAAGVAGAAAWAARGAAWIAVWDAAWSAACAAARAAAKGAVWDAVWNAEQEWQFTRLIERLSDHEPDDWPLPSTNQLQPVE